MQPPGRMGAWLLPAAWFGLLGGAIEAAIVAVQHFGLGHFTFLSRQLYWMAPASLACLLAVIALILLPVFSRWASGWSWAMGFFAFCASLSVLLHVPRFHPLALSAVAAGIGVQVARLAASRREGFDRLVRRSLPALAALVALVALILNVPRALSERRSLAAMPAARAGSPNVLLLILDTVRAIDLSLYGYTRATTPTLDALAARGIVFDHAISAAPWTLPSHAAIFTGHNAVDLSASWRVPLDRTYPTLAEVLTSAGYLTAGFAANHAYTSNESGLNRGFVHYEGIPDWSPSNFFTASALVRKLVASDGLHARFGSHNTPGRTSGDALSHNAETWIAAHPRRPFFVFMNFYDAHDPFLAPAPFDTMFTGRRTLSRERNLALEAPAPVSSNDPAIRAERDAYDQSIRWQDSEVGGLLETLRAQGALENTLIIIASDHGEEFGEHGVLSHGNSLYLPSLHVPLVMLWPGHIPAGRRIESTIALRDLAATIMDLTGAPGTMPGRSLRSEWDSSAGPASPSPAVAEVRYAPRVAKWFPIAKGDMASVVTPARQLIRGGNGAFELFDLERGPNGDVPAPAGDSSASRLKPLLPAPHR